MKLIRGISCLIFFLPGILLSETSGQNKRTDNFLEKGVEIHNTLSYSGFSNSVVLFGRLKKFHFYAGPRILTSQAYLLRDGPWGLQTGLRYYYLSSLNLKASVGLDYQLSLIENQTGELSRMNKIHEINIFYGINIRLWGSLRVGSHFGFGKYFENFHDIQMNTPRNYSGFSGLIKLYVQYDF